MSSINGVGGSGDAWMAMRSQMQARMLAKADVNSDGGVDKTELSSMLGDINKMTGQSLGADSDDTFKSMDGNGDGKLSSVELWKGMEKLMPPPSTLGFVQSRSSSNLASSGGDSIDDLFAKVDSNGDGSIDKSELKSLAEQVTSGIGMDRSSKLGTQADDTTSRMNSAGGSGDVWAEMHSQMQARAFAKTDSNSDGGIDQTELSSLLRDINRVTGQNLGGDIDETFKSMDGNGDGELSSDEIGKGMEKLMPPLSTMGFAQLHSSSGLRSPGSRPIDDLFAKVDGNGDGSLDKSELQALAVQIKSDTGLDVSSTFDKLADDNGGKVSKDQLQAAIEKELPPGAPGGAGRAQSASASDSKSYDSLDTNKDGTVSDFERLIGELKSTNSNSSATKDIAQFAQNLYEKFAQGMSHRARGSNMSTVA